MWDHPEWDGAEPRHTYLSHDPLCVGCGHAQHSYLPCSDTCDCRPAVAVASLAVPA